MGNYVNDLKHPINPVFDWDLWENELISAVNLVPVLRLASLMLESPASQRFIYSLINTDSHHRMSVETGRFNCHFRKSTAPDDVVQATFKLALEELTKIVTYRFHRKLPNLPDSAYGTTIVTRDDSDVVTRCHIAIKTRGFRDTFAPETKRSGVTAVNRARFVLVTTFCHEVIDAIECSVPEECNSGSEDHVWHHYEYQTEWEVGWAWEMEVLGAIRIGCSHIGEGDTLHALPALNQDFEELDFDGEQHTCAVIPTIPIDDYINRLWRQEFWDKSPRTGTMLRLSTQPHRSSTKSSGREYVSSRSPTDPLYQALEERAKRNDRLKASLAAESAGTASQEQIDYLRTSREFLAKRKSTAALIRRINVGHLLAEHRDGTLGLEADEDEGATNSC